MTLIFEKAFTRRALLKSNEGYFLLLQFLHKSEEMYLLLLHFLNLISVLICIEPVTSPEEKINTFNFGFLTKMAVSIMMYSV